MKMSECRDSIFMDTNNFKLMCFSFFNVYRKYFLKKKTSKNTHYVYNIALSMASSMRQWVAVFQEA